MIKGSDNLRETLVTRAENDAHFIASAIAAWRVAHPDIPPHKLLRCRQEDLWRVALAPRPKSSTDLPTAARSIADAFEIDIEGLISLLRLADALEGLRSPSSQLTTS